MVEDSKDQPRIPMSRLHNQQGRVSFSEGKTGYMYMVKALYRGSKLKLFHVCKCSVTRKPVFGVSERFRHKLGCTATEREDGQMLNFRFRKKREYTIHVVKEKKGADYRGVTARLI